VDWPGAAQLKGTPLRHLQISFRCYNPVTKVYWLSTEDRIYYTYEKRKEVLRDSLVLRPPDRIRSAEMRQYQICGNGETFSRCRSVWYLEHGYTEPWSWVALHSDRSQDDRYQVCRSPSDCQKLQPRNVGRMGRINGYNPVTKVYWHSTVTSVYYSMKNKQVDNCKWCGVQLKDQQSDRCDSCEDVRASATFRPNKWDGRLNNSQRWYHVRQAATRMGNQEELRWALCSVRENGGKMGESRSDLSDSIGSG